MLQVAETKYSNTTLFARIAMVLCIFISITLTIITFCFFYFKKARILFSIQFSSQHSGITKTAGNATEILWLLNIIEWLTGLISMTTS